MPERGNEMHAGKRLRFPVCVLPLNSLRLFAVRRFQIPRVRERVDCRSSFNEVDEKLSTLFANRVVYSRHRDLIIAITKDSW